MRVDSRAQHYLSMGRKPPSAGTREQQDDWHDGDSEDKVPQPSLSEERQQHEQQESQSGHVLMN